MIVVAMFVRAQGRLWLVVALLGDERLRALAVSTSDLELVSAGAPGVAAFRTRTYSASNLDAMYDAPELDDPRPPRRRRRRRPEVRDERRPSSFPRGAAGSRGSWRGRR